MGVETDKMHEEEEEQRLGLSMLTEPEKACPEQDVQTTSLDCRCELTIYDEHDAKHISHYCILLFVVSMRTRSTHKGFP